jgi:poly-gamma-glutamate synthesis protein (capsule biosynthesis protein)
MNAIDWKNGTWNLENSGESGATILLGGDWAPVRGYKRLLSSHPGRLYSRKLLRIFDQSDFRALNVESVLHPHPDTLRPVFKEGPPLKGPAAAVADLQALGINLAFLANNHIYDFGKEGLVSTREGIEEAGMRTCGTGTSPEDAHAGVTVDLKGVRLAFVNFQEGEEGFHTERIPEVAGWDLDRARVSIQRHREAGRMVIAVPHADREFLPLPAPYIQAAYRGLVDAGASAVVAHHPHVPRGIEIYKEVPIFYSLGNFAFWQEHQGIFRKLGYLVRLHVNEAGCVAWELFPYRLYDGCIDLLDTQERLRFLKRMESVSGGNLNPECVLTGWNAAIDAISEESWFVDCTGMDYGMRKMKERNPIGLARLRTRLSSPSHSLFMEAGITRILDGQHGKSDPRLIERVKLWTDETDWDRL